MEGHGSFEQVQALWQEQAEWAFALDVAEGQANAHPSLQLPNLPGVEAGEMDGAVAAAAVYPICMQKTECQLCSVTIKTSAVLLSTHKPAKEMYVSCLAVQQANYSMKALFVTFLCRISISYFPAFLLLDIPFDCVSVHGLASLHLGLSVCARLHLYAHLLVCQACASVHLSHFFQECIAFCLPNIC